MPKHKIIFNTTKWKVILAFFSALFALSFAWYISKGSFAQILSVVEEISQPNVRLKIVNRLTYNVAQLAQIQKKESVNNEDKASYLTESKKIKIGLDTLRALYLNDQNQLVRIESLKKLLSDRDRQFLAYLKVRGNLIDAKSFSGQIKKLNQIVSEKSKQLDSELTTQTTVSTTTIAPSEELKAKSFLGRIFGKKRAEAYKIISEEFKTKRDTINPKVEDSLVNSLDDALSALAKAQRVKGLKFLQQEADLAVASNTLTRQMLRVLHEVEIEAVLQVDQNAKKARLVVNSGITKISVILLVFFLLTIILLGLILSDITKSNQYRKALEEAKDDAEYHGKAKQRFLSNMSHEIRTPLQAIIGYSELIKQQDVVQKKDIHSIYQSSIHLLQIVNEILDYNRIISGEFSFVKRTFKIQDVLDEVLAVVLPLADKKSLTLTNQMDIVGIEYVIGDDFRLKQVLYNIIGNAIKFTFNGEIKVSVLGKRQAEQVHLNISVEDTGIGFPEAQVEKIFTVFEQVRSAENNNLNGAGTGLGLSIVKALVEGQSGRLYVKSKVGVGTNFNIFLKYDFADAPTDHFLEEIKPIISTRKSVWIIDDDSLILDLCGLILERHKIPFRCFNKVVDILSEQPTDELAFVLIDMRLPETTGLEVCKKLKRKLSPNVVFYAITAQVLPDERTQVLNEGFDGLIMKPFREADLLSIFDDNDKEKIGTELDFSNLEKMTFGNKQVLAEIIMKCGFDSSDDAAQLKLVLQQGTKAEVRLIVHRLAGRMAQIGANTLASALRNLELDIEKEGITSTTRNAVLKQLDELDKVLFILNEMDTAETLR